MVQGELDWYTQKMKLDHQPTPCTTINSKWIKYLNISHDTIKIPEENIGSRISDTLHSKIFADVSPRARKIKRKKINKWDYIKLKSFCTAKEKSIKMKGQLTICENIFANDTTDKDFISKIYKELTQLHTGKTNNPIRKWAKERVLAKKEE